MKRLFPLFLALSLSLSLSACGAPTVGDVGASEQFFAMDTIMTVNVLDENGEAAVQAARPRSTGWSRCSPAPGGQRDRPAQHPCRRRSALAVERELGALLRFAQSVSQDLPGCFDITIAPVMDAWGFTREERHVPDPDTLADTLALVDWRALDGSGGRCLRPAGGARNGGRPRRRGQRLCRPSAPADAHGAWPEAPPPLLDLGGNITVLGSKPDVADWRVAVKDPQDHRASVGRGLSAGQNAFHLRRV